MGRGKFNEAQDLKITRTLKAPVSPHEVMAKAPGWCESWDGIAAHA